MPTPIDIVFAILFAVVIAGIEAFYFDRRFKAQVAAGVPNARRNAYRRAILGQWMITAVAIVIWVNAGRAWTALGLAGMHGWHSDFSLGIVAGMLAVTTYQIVAIRRIGGNQRQAVRAKLADVEFLLPRTPNEYRWFLVLAVTAGICEELLYRGYLTWLLAAYVGLPASIALVTIAFGGAHAYQGAKGVVKTGLVGLGMSLLVVASGWVIPAMVVHALIDISAGVLGYTILSRDERDAPGSAAVP
jgi:membrane protease YdiL (CAAX protease family)